jgi:hypothetical protein
MIRDITVVAGSHQREVVPYIRPEILGFVLDSSIIAFAFKEFRTRGEEPPLVRFFGGGWQNSPKY